MQHEPNESNAGDDEHDPVFEHELKALYQTALLDEDFQQQVASNVQSLPDDVQRRLSQQPAVKAFLYDEAMPAHLQSRLRAIQVGEKIPWWKTLCLPEGWALLPLPGPAFSLPAVLVVGGLLGMLLPTLLTPPAPSEAVQLRNTAVASEANACQMTETVRENPVTWWSAIQQCEAQAEQETAALQQRYPNFQPSKP